MRNINKKGVIGLIAKVFTAIVLLLVIYLVFFDSSGLIESGFTQVRELIKGVPEVDATKNELDFARNNAKQLEFFSEFNAAVQKAAKCQTTNSFCISELPIIDQNGFYDKEGSYNLYIEKTDEGMQVRFTKYKKLDTDEKTAATETPVQVNAIKEVSPCIIKGEGADYFYNSFLETSNAVKNKGKILTTQSVETLEISAGKTRDTMRQIGVKEGANSDYVWYDFFKKKDKTQTYILKTNLGGTQQICFFPVYSDSSWYTFGISSVCNEPKDGLIDSDCFDVDEGNSALKTNIDNKKISKDYLCTSDTACKILTT